MIDLKSIHRLSDIPRAQARARGNDVAIKFEGCTTTYAELDHRADQVAQALIAMDVAPQDRVCVLTKNCGAFFELFFGAAKARICLAPINFRLSAAEIAYILRDARPPALFVGEDLLDVVAQIAADLDFPVRLIALTGACDGYEAFAAWRDAASAEDPRLEALDEDDVLQLYTSGTTGHPKGVRLSNRNYTRFMQISVGVEGFNYEAGETIMIVMPLFHVAGTNVSFAGLANGCCVVVVKDFIPREALAMMQRDGISHTFIAPAMIQMLLHAPEMAQARFPLLKTIAYGASPISEEVLSRAKTGFGCGFVQFYGMTESTGTGAYLSPSDHLRADKLRSCGRPWPEVEIAVVDGEGVVVPVGAVGEIAIRGDIVMSGYWNNSAASTAAVRDGWLLTGDAGYFDEEGFLYIHDRMKDMIITGGENVYPAEVENAIHGCTGVADVAVVGVPSERWGEEVKAIVVIHPAESPTSELIIAYARERIAAFKAPKSVDFIDVLPRNASGKILRRTLREPYWRGRGRGIG